MQAHEFVLQKYDGIKTRYICPSCNKEKQFTKYINTGNGEYIAPQVGICNRSSKCGYHYTPKQYFNDHPEVGKIISLTKRPVMVIPPNIIDVPISFIDKDIVNKSLDFYDNNNFVQFLLSLFNKEKVYHLINIYKIGTSSRWGGGTSIFWQIDINGKIRSGKLIKYDPIIGKRIKDPFVHTNWVHSIIDNKQKYNLKQCLFGEHLLKEAPNAPVAIVESEKTAIICQAFYPEYIWLATSGLSEFKYDKLKVLKNRRIVAFPDLGCYNKWKDKASEWDLDITVSSYLEERSSKIEKDKGYDLADYIIQFNKRKVLRSTM